MEPDLQAVLTQAAEAESVPGATVAVWHQGAVVAAHHGVTSVDEPLDVDDATLFQAGSITKTYTATAVMRLVDQGLVDLDMPVRTYVSDLTLSDESVAATVTTRHLLNHSSGWRGDFILDTGDGDDALATYVERMAGLDQLTPLGEAASYNNAAFNLAGHVIARVTGQTYEAAIRTLVFEPLGLHDSYFFPDEVKRRRHSAGHAERDGSQRVVDTWGLPRSGNPSGGIACTAGDLLTFARLHLDEGVAPGGTVLLSPESARAMRTPTGPGGQTGIGWSVGRLGDTELISHGGSMPGQQAVLTLAPEHDFAVTVLTNSTAGLQLCGQLSQWVLQTYLGVVPPPPPEPLEVSPEELRAYEGRYDGGLYVMALTADETHLVIDELTLTDDGREQLTAAGVELPALSGSRIQLLEGDLFLIVDGPFAGQTGGILRGDDGDVNALNLGRVLPKLP